MASGFCWDDRPQAYTSLSSLLTAVSLVFLLLGTGRAQQTLGNPFLAPFSSHGNDAQREQTLAEAFLIQATGLENLLTIPSCITHHLFGYPECNQDKPGGKLHSTHVLDLHSGPFHIGLLYCNNPWLFLLFFCSNNIITVATPFGWHTDFSPWTCRFPSYQFFLR